MPLIESLVKWEGKTKHLVLSRVPFDPPLDPDQLWRDRGEQRAKDVAAASAEKEIPRSPLVSTQGFLCTTNFEGTAREPAVVRCLTQSQRSFHT